MPWFSSRICCQILLLHKYTSEPKLLVLDIVNLTLRNKCSSSVYLYSDSVLSDFSRESFVEYELPHFSEVCLDFYITMFTVCLLIIRHLQQKSYITAFRRAWLLGGIGAWHLGVMEITYSIWSQQELLVLHASKTKIFVCSSKKSGFGRSCRRLGILGWRGVVLRRPRKCKRWDACWC